MTESKKTWVEPELIVLVRSKPEEAVLVACKNTGAFGDPNAEHDDCVGLFGCEVCAVSVGS
jgi:hypothetical protein